MYLYNSSSSEQLLGIPKTRLNNYGDSAAAPCMWNIQPVSIRRSLKKNVKTDHFRTEYDLLTFNVLTFLRRIFA